MSETPISVTDGWNGRAFSDPRHSKLTRETFAAFGERFEPAWSTSDTTERIFDALTAERADVPPEPIQPWECRIGASKFFVPPLNINVSQTFKAGSMTGGAIRQQNTPKFNTGHTETVVTMSVYFPNYEEIWGFEDQIFRINFDKELAANPAQAGDPSAINRALRAADEMDNATSERIDKFLSSLRGLIAQFKYAPFLPVRNTHLNQTFGITGVVLKDLTISTVPNFPFVLVATLTLLKFNHKVFLPMIEHFDQAIHWGKFRQFMGRAAGRLAQSSRPIKSFATLNTINNSPTDFGEIKPSVRSAREVLEDSHIEDVPGRQTYRRHSIFESNRFDFYYPFHTPAAIDLPDLSDLRYQEINWSQNPRDWWQRLLDNLGITINNFPEADLEKLRSMSRDQGASFIKGQNEFVTLIGYLETLNISFDLMGPTQLEEYYQKRLREEGISSDSGAGRELRSQIRQLWFLGMYRLFMEDPSLARALATQDKRRKQLTIDEWEVPMWKLNLDQKYVKVQGVSVTLGNTVAKLQLQMQDEPTYQHIGGADPQINISLLITGEHSERELIKLRTMFESVTGLARLEHGHGVLGFVGVENVITELCGIRYCVPLGFEVDTIPNQPHSYEVRITLTDFDIFQQKREMLSSEQQAQLVEAFGKRNPFLRLKQLWGIWNAYPDFPLSVRDSEGKIIGHLDPDFYFRSFRTIDDDIVETPQTRLIRDPRQPASKTEERRQNLGDIEKEERLSARRKENTSYDFTRESGVHHCIGVIDGEPQYISIDDYGCSFYSGKNPKSTNLKINEAHAGNMIGRPYIEGLTPPSGYIEPYQGASGDPTLQFASMAKDMQYRDNAGRMIKAFPTYMMWFVHESSFAGMKLFDNFYGLQSVLDLSIVQSEDILGDTLVIRLSNLYSKLSTKFHDYLDENDPGARIINQITRRAHTLATGMGDFILNLDTIDLKPGVRVHLRLGYGSNPNKLDTVFNGVITEVQTGEIVTIVAQSDAIELSALVNSTNEKGHTGRIDGSLFGMFLSEPRDLMTTLLTMGSSRAKEVIAHATQGEVFSENKFGIRHFGTMLYTPLDGEEFDKDGRRKDKLSSIVDRHADAGRGMFDIPGFTSLAMMDVLDGVFRNLAAKRDYEIFKRNIYPGNGTGVAQFMGGDLGDIGLTIAIDSTGNVAGTGVGPDGTTSITGTTQSPRDVQAALDAAVNARTATPNAEADSSRLPRTHGLLHTLGIINPNTDEGPFDEVAFRAQTYMRTVWDLFKVCAALLPDYIVAVRPFEERSTVFYGKPHWNYTSGVIPLSSGVTPQDGPAIEAPDDIWRTINQKIKDEMNRKDQMGVFDDFLSATGEHPNPDPTQSTDGLPNTGNSPSTGGRTGANLAAFAAMQAGFTGEDLVTAVAVAGAESGWNPRAQNARSTATGLWQIMFSVWGSKVGASKRSDLHDPILNARAAKMITEQPLAFRHGKWSDWAVHPDAASRGFYHRSADYSRHIPEARRAVAEEQAKAGGNPTALHTQIRERQTEISSYTTEIEEATRVNTGDTYGKQASEMYIHNRTEEQANQVWNEFREYFPKEDAAKRAFTNARRFQNLSESDKKEISEDHFTPVASTFVDFMWNNGYARGWLVKVASRRTGDIGGVLQPLNPVGAAQALTRGVRGLLSILGFGDDTFTAAVFRNWDFGPTYALFTVYIDGGDQAALTFMKNNDGDGRNQSFILNRGIEAVGAKIKGVWDRTIGRVIGAVGTIASGIINTIRLNMVMLSAGMSMASDMQSKANSLNRIFNDSIYYSAGVVDGQIVNPLLYYADNPFTREYGEPVVEIRQPFQRMHMISSFQHIINNGIIESTEDVATVVTAISNGKDPVTVHFDKSAPAEKQFEKQVETGLFWDHPKGWFGLQKLAHPIETARWWMKSTGVHGDGNSMETSAKRVALTHLKESLKDIYQGEIITLGDASIRPHDLVFMADIYERMSGFFEVEQVVHTLTPEEGFITSITPNACVSINDPARFAFLSYWKSRSAIKETRDNIRHTLQVHADNNAGVARIEVGGSNQALRTDEMSIEDIADRVSLTLENSLQYTGGATSVVKNFLGTAGGAGLMGGSVAGVGAAFGPAGAGLGAAAGLLGWKGWSWIRENLLDQQGCYIQYLTHNGQPMDAGLSHNHGVAVGHQFTMGIVLAGLRVGDISMLGPDGSPRIRTQDVVKLVQWDETGPNNHAREVDLFVDQIMARVREVAGYDGIHLRNFASDIYWARVTNVVDGDTIDVRVTGQLRHGEFMSASVTLGDNNRVRFAGMDAPEDEFKFRPNSERNTLHANDPGVRATEYLKSRLMPGGVGRDVALRIYSPDPEDVHGRAVAYIFHEAPDSITTPLGRRDFILNAAGGLPAVAWDSYTIDGKPYTINWEMIAAGHGDVYANDLKRSLPGRGARGG